MNFSNRNLLETWGSQELILNDLSTAQIGNYKCVGRNDHGQATVHFTVSIKNRLKIISATYANLVNNYKQFSCVVDSGLRSSISILDPNITFASIDTSFKDLEINSTIYFDKDGQETKFTEAKTLLNSGQNKFSAFTRISETSFKFDLTTKSRRKPETFKCSVENVDTKSEKEFISADNPNEFVDGEGSKVFISAALNQKLSLFCRIKSHNGVWWYMVRTGCPSKRPPFLSVLNFIKSLILNRYFFNRTKRKSRTAQVTSRLCIRIRGWTSKAQKLDMKTLSDALPGQKAEQSFTEAL